MLIYDSNYDIITVISDIKEKLGKGSPFSLLEPSSILSEFTRSHGFKGISKYALSFVDKEVSNNRLIM